MCKCIKYSEVKNEIQQHLKKGMLIPVLGSGFTNAFTFAMKSQSVLQQKTPP